MKTEYKYEGETFLLDDSKGCYTEVTFAGMTAYVGVNLHNGTDDQPYTFTIENQHVDDDGIKLPTGGSLATPDSALQRACTYLLARHSEQQAHESFDQKQACENLHQFIKSLSESSDN